jgi:hypothetical protein
VEKFARSNEHLRADIEGVVQPAVLFHGSEERFFSPAKNNIVIAESKTGHRRVGEPPDMFQTENFAVKLLGFFEIVYGN